MNEHTQISDLLPLYVSGALGRDQRAAVEAHLNGCPECQADLALWKSVGVEVAAAAQADAQAPRDLADRALARLQRPGQITARAAGRGQKIGQVMTLLRSQVRLVQREIWPASAAVIALGYVAALIAEHSGFIYVLAPLIAAACVSFIYGPENDPAYELALSTPTSPRQILLARLVLVFGYNLMLVFAATLALLPVLDQPLLSSLTLSWLAPMTFLSSAALVLSLWIGAPNAISITYAAWLSYLIAGPLRSPEAMLELSPFILDGMSAYQNFWQTPLLLLGLSAALLAVAVWLAGGSGRAVLRIA